MNHSITAIETAKGSTWNLDDYAEKHKWKGVDILYAINRDSDVLYKSNWEHILESMKEAPEGEWDVAHLFHWAVGWVEYITFNTANKKIHEYLTRIENDLADYPVLDEVLYSKMEWEENHPNGDKECYCDDEDCPIKMAIVLQRHEDAYGDEHDENCPLCGVDAQTKGE